MRDYYCTCVAKCNLQYAHACRDHEQCGPEVYTCTVAATSGCPPRRPSPSPCSSLLELSSSSVRARLAAGAASSDIVLGHLIVRLRENSLRETCAKTPGNIFLYRYIGESMVRRHGAAGYRAGYGYRVQVERAPPGITANLQLQISSALQCSPGQGQGGDGLERRNT